MQKIGATQEAADEGQRELLSLLQDELRTTVPRRRIIEAVLVDVAENEELAALIHDFLTE